MRVGGCLLFVAMFALPSACLDMPIHRVSKTDNPIADSGAGNDGEVDPATACKACIAAPEDPGPGCKMSYDACAANGMCKTMLECAFDDHCFLAPRRDFLNCAVPCLTKAGVDTMNAAVLEIASSLFQCLANGPCGDLCFID